MTSRTSNTWPTRDLRPFIGTSRTFRDPRIERTLQDPLINIIFIAVCGVLSGANSIAGIHEFAFDRHTWFARYLDLTNGIPSEDTIGRVPGPPRSGAFEKCLLSWIQTVQELTEDHLVAIDGKTLRGSGDHERGRAAIHMVSAWAAENKLSLGQVVVSEKSNEITAIPELLQLLDISGALVTIDAMGCQKGDCRPDSQRVGRTTYWPSRRTSRRCTSRSRKRSPGSWNRMPKTSKAIKPWRKDMAATKPGHTPSFRSQSWSIPWGCGVT